MRLLIEFDNFFRYGPMMELTIIFSEHYRIHLENHVDMLYILLHLCGRTPVMRACPSPSEPEEIHFQDGLNAFVQKVV